ncbi:hypothetical protein [Corynebacterium sp.]|uniref:hypothetical protein n=2 Tax=Corynebacterium sp. TaxID=1720 RepID=UPI0028B1A1EC|nr:hypothetical protein [Corynebacterium sp.]
MENGAHLRRGVTPDQWAARMSWSAVLTDGVTPEWALHESDDNPDQWTLRQDGDDGTDPDTVAVTDDDPLVWTADNRPDWWPPYVPGNRLDKLTAYCALRGRHRADATALVDGLDDDPRDWDWFWDQDPELGKVRDWADFKGSSRWTVLGVALAWIVANVPPNRTLGGDDAMFRRGSLNLFIATVGDAGSGKGTAVDTALNLVQLPDGFGPRAQTMPTGSAEGMARVLQPTPPADEDDDQDNDNEKSGNRGRADEPIPGQPAQVMFRSDELSRLLAEGQRNRGQASTMGGYLASMWSGEELGAVRVNKSDSRDVPEHGYRACLFTAAQPEFAADLMSQTSGGLAQRFVYLPADPRVADVRRGRRLRRAGQGEPDRVQLTNHALGYPEGVSAGQFVLTDVRNGIQGYDDRVPEDPAVTDELEDRKDDRVDAMNEWKKDRTRPKPDGNSHRDFSQLKVAAALGILLHKRLEVTADVWAMAEVVMDVSDLVVRETRMIAQQAAEQAAVEAELDRRRVYDTADTRQTNEVFNGARRKLLALVENNTRSTQSDFQQTLSRAQRKVMGAVIQEAAEDGLVQVVKDKRPDNSVEVTYLVAAK